MREITDSFNVLLETKRIEYTDADLPFAQARFCGAEGLNSDEPNYAAALAVL